MARLDMGGENLILLERGSYDLALSVQQVKVELNLEPWNATKGIENVTCFLSSFILISLMCHLFPLIR